MDIIIDGTTRVYADSELPRYEERLKVPGNGLGVSKPAASTNLTEEGVVSHALKSISNTGATGKRTSLTIRDCVPRATGIVGEVTIVINVYHDGAYPDDLKRASYMLSGAAAAVTASQGQVLSDMSDLGIVSF